MSDNIKFKLQLDAATLGVTRLIKKIDDKRLLHDAIGQSLVSRIVLGFSRSAGPYGPWQPLSPITIARRRNKSNKPLLDTGRLRNSITHEFSSRSVRVGTNVEYAVPHQLGAKIGAAKIPRRAFLPDKGLPREWEQEDVVETVEAFIEGGL